MSIFRRPLFAAAALLAGLAIALGAAVSNAVADDDDAPPMVLRHTVLFKFKPEATAAQVRAVEAAFAALPSKIDAIEDFEWGTDVGVENLSQGFTHCFVVTFHNEAGRARYLSHPDHDAFKEVAGPALDQALVVDYWTKS